MTRDNFFTILELSPTENSEANILKAIKKKQAEWSKLRNHPSKGRLAQKNLSLLKDIKKVMLDDALRAKEAKELLGQHQKDEANLKKELLKQVELLSSKGKIYQSELDILKTKFSSLDVKSYIKVKVIQDANTQTTHHKLKHENFLPTLEYSTLQKIKSSLQLLNKRDLYHFLNTKSNAPLAELKKITEKKYLENNKSAAKTAEVTSTSELLGIVKSMLQSPKRKELYDNSLILNKLTKLDELIEISGKNGVIEKEEYLFIYEEGKSHQLNDTMIKDYLTFVAKHYQIKLEKPDFSKPLTFRNKENNASQLFDLIRQNEARDIEDLLSKAEVDLNKKNKHGSTPLILATYSGHLKIVKILLDNGADVNLSNQDKTPPLIWAIVGDHTQIARHLLNHQANINAQDKHGYSALMWAASKTNEPLVKLLLQYNADTTLKNHAGETAYELAKKAGNIRLFYIIKDHKGQNRENLKDNIFQALASNDLVYLSKLYGVNFNAFTDDHQNTLLHLAIKQGKRDVIDWILDNNKININAQNHEGTTPLIEAVTAGDDVTVSTLIKKTAIEINKIDHDGYTPLIHAVNTGNTYLVKTLLAHQAKMEVEDPNGNRALTIAVWQDRRDIIKYLIDYGARTNILTHSGKSLMDLAKSKKNASLMDYLAVYLPNEAQSITPSQSEAKAQPIEKAPRKKTRTKAKKTTSENPSSSHPDVSTNADSQKPQQSKDKKEKKPWWKFW